MVPRETPGWQQNHLAHHWAAGQYRQIRVWCKQRTELDSCGFRIGGSNEVCFWIWFWSGPRHVPRAAWKITGLEAADELIVDLGVSTSFGPTTRSKHGLKRLFRTCLWARKEVSLPPPPQNRFTKLEWTMLTSMVKETATKGIKNQCPKADFLVL